jgi:hypothetical protein
MGPVAPAELNARCDGDERNEQAKHTEAGPRRECVGGTDDHSDLPAGLRRPEHLDGALDGGG